MKELTCLTQFALCASYPLLQTGRIFKKAILVAGFWHVSCCMEC